VDRSFPTSHVTSSSTTFLFSIIDLKQQQVKMSPPNNRKEILASLRKSIDNGQIIVGAGAGIGLSAKFIEQGGGDLIIIYNSGRYRMAGRGSLAGLMPYGNANDVVLEMVSQSSVRRSSANILLIAPH
jgi:predicted TIM-barrel enzyme